MKSLEYYIKTHKLENFINNSLYNEALCNFFDKDEIKTFESINNDIILETLNSHDFQKIKLRLLKLYSNDIIEIINNSDKKKDSFEIIFRATNTSLNIIKSDKLNNSLEYYGYFKAAVLTINGSIKCTNLDKYDLKDLITFYNNNGSIILMIEPKYSDIANDTLNNSHYICYHFTNISNIDSILKNGLRCKSASSKDAPERIYLYCDINIIDNNNHIKENIVKTIYEIFGNNIKLNDICAIKIDMNELKNITVYKDTLMYDNHSVFIYNNIPKQYIKKVINFKDYL